MSAGWRHPDAVDDGWPNLALMQHIAATAERGKFDMFFLGDGFATGYGEHPSTIGKFEPLTLLSALAMATTARPRRHGLDHLRRALSIARAFASLDHLSGGRAGWNVVTTAYAKSARRVRPPAPAARRALCHGRGVRRGLPDPVGQLGRRRLRRDKQAGRFVGRAACTCLFRESTSPSRARSTCRAPPQGHPVLIQAGSSGPGQALAARIADVVFTAQNDLDEALAFYAA